MDEVQGPTDSGSIADRLRATPTKPRRKPLWLRTLDRLVPPVRTLLVSPLHRLVSGRLMLVTVKGRRTETIYTFPVGYLEIDALVVTLVPRALERSWWRNFIEPRYASITIRGGRTSALGIAPPPGSPEFVKAAEQALRGSRLARRMLRAKLDREGGLSDAQAERLAEHARVVIFDRAPHLDAEATSSTPRAGSAAARPEQRGPRPSLDAMEAAELRLTDLMAPVLGSLARSDQPAALALAERVAAERYRLWAAEISDPNVRAMLEECAVREDDVASRVEAAVPGALTIQESVASSHPQLAIRYLELFEPMSLPTQLAFQARLQRAAAEQWRSLAECSPPLVRATLLECSYLEERNAAALDELLAHVRTS